MVAGRQLFLSRTFIGRAIQAVAQDQQALRLMAPFRPASSASPSGSPSPRQHLLAAMIIIQPVEPSIGREYIGRFRHQRAGRPRQLSAWLILPPSRSASSRA